MSSNGLLYLNPKPENSQTNKIHNHSDIEYTPETHQLGKITSNNRSNRPNNATRHKKQGIPEPPLFSRRQPRHNRAPRRHTQNTGEPIQDV